MQISEATRFLENAYVALNNKFLGGQLPPVIITIQSSPRAYGHYTTWENTWVGEGQGFHEINIGAETLDRDASEVLATLSHEMVHHYCAVNNIKDTSRGGTYHNKTFKEVAEGTGAILVDYDPRIGYSPTRPTDALIAFIEEQGWTGVNLSRQSILGLPGGKGRGRSNGVRKYVCPNCHCSVRATKAVNIGCLDCGTVMELEEK